MLAKLELDGFERLSRTHKWAGPVWLPLLNGLPCGARSWIARSCPAAERMVRERTSFRALEAMYGYDADCDRGLWTAVWQNLITVRATRNRLKLVRQLVRECLEPFQRLPDTRVASIACGSARAVIEALAELPGSASPAELRCCDISSQALTYCRDLFQEHLAASGHQIACRRANVKEPKWALEGSPHVVEMVGLLDYFGREDALHLLAAIHESLAPGGFLIVGNIRPHAESGFINRVIGWNLIERQPDEFRELLEAAGFAPEDVRLHHEPLHVHMVAVCQRR